MVPNFHPKIGVSRITQNGKIKQNLAFGQIYFFEGFPKADQWYADQGGEGEGFCQKLTIIAVACHNIIFDMIDWQWWYEVLKTFSKTLRLAVDMDKPLITFQIKLNEARTLGCESVAWVIWTA